MSEHGEIMNGVTTVKKIIEGGLGLAFFEGKTVFLPYAAPGEMVEFSVLKESGNILFSRIEKILEPSDMRIEPECPNFSRCPGCELLHLDYKNEIKIKKGMTEETLRRIGKSEIEIEEIITSPDRFGYKNSAVFEFDQSGRPGLRDTESGTVIPFPPEGCPLLSEKMRDALRELTGRSVRGEGPALARADKFGSIQFWGVEGMIELPDILIERGGNLFPVKPRSPVMDNRFLNDRFVETVASMPGDETSELTDLYCGPGILSLAFRERGIKVIGIDENRDIIEDARAAVRLNNIDGVEFMRGRIGKTLRSLKRSKSMVISPPASGIPGPLLKEIIRKTPEEIIIDSADAATLARDISRFRSEGYSIEKSCLIDLYPGRSSSEILIRLQRRRSG